MDTFTHDALPARQRLLRTLTLTLVVVMSAWFGYNYWAREGNSEAVIALYGGALFVTAIAVIPIFLRRMRE